MHGAFGAITHLVAVSNDWYTGGSGGNSCSWGAATNVAKLLGLSLSMLGVVRGALSAGCRLPEHRYPRDTPAGRMAHLRGIATHTGG